MKLMLGAFERCIFYIACADQFPVFPSDFSDSLSVTGGKQKNAFGYLKRFNILAHRYRGRLDARGIRKVRNIMKVLIHLTQFKKNQEAYRHCTDCLAR